MKVLVVIDMQNDFITGPLGTKEAQAIVPRVKEKIRNAVENGDYIFYTRDTHHENYLETMEGRKLPVKHCIQGSLGWYIPCELFVEGTYDNSYTVDKYTFGDYRLSLIIREFMMDDEIPLSSISEIELVGLCTDCCVVTNAIILKTEFSDEVEISVDATCCAGVTPETHEAALKTMEMCQINVKRERDEVLPTIQ